MRRIKVNKIRSTKKIKRALSSRWVFALIGIPLFFFLRGFLTEKFNIPNTKSSVLTVPMIYIFCIVYVVLTDEFSNFKNKFVGFSLFGIFSVLSSILIGIALDRGILPVPKAGDTWYDLLIVGVFFWVTLKLTDWSEKTISENFLKQKSKNRKSA